MVQVHYDPCMGKLNEFPKLRDEPIETPGFVLGYILRKKLHGDLAAPSSFEDDSVGSLPYLLGYFEFT